MKDLAEGFHDFANRKQPLNPDALCLLSARSVGVYRYLYRHDGDEYRSRFSELLLAYAVRLGECGRDDDALHCFREALDTQREQRMRDPEAYSEIFLPPPGPTRQPPLFCWTPQ